MNQPTRSLWGERLTIKELAFYLDLPREAIHAMKLCGFTTDEDNRATLAEARRWIKRHPGFRWHRVYRERARWQRLTKAE